MRFDRSFFTSPAGQIVLVAIVLGIGFLTVRWQRQARAVLALPGLAAKPAPAVPLPVAHAREVVRFPKPAPVTVGAPAQSTAFTPVTAIRPVSRVAPLNLFTAAPEPARTPEGPSAPYGRLIPCETVFAIESNRLETPIIGLVTQDVWHSGRIIIPAGAEVHGRASLDRTRERIASQGSWRIVWRTPGARNGEELATEGLALNREFDPATQTWGEADGSAGLAGTIVKTNDERELKLFAATFLGAATAALQDTQSATGLLGATALPAATAHNAVLAGTGAVLRDYAQSIRDAIARDGFYLRVPAGKSFYLYATQTLRLGAPTGKPLEP